MKRDHRTAAQEAAFERMQVMDEALYTAPVINPERNQLREVVRLKPDKLAARARKFLTLGAVYAERDRGNPLHEPAARWEDWLRSFLPPADARAMMKLQRSRQASDNARNDEEGEA